MTLAFRGTLGRATTLLCGTLTACAGPDADSAVQRADSAGVEVVTYRGSDRPLPWRFHVAFALGGKDTDEESFYRLDRSTVGVDASGNIYVLDASANRVVVFDATGSHVRSMGGEGGGPGEMRFPVTMVVAPDGRVDIFDVSKRGFVRFGPAGEILEEERVTVSLGTGAARYVGHTLILPLRNVDTDRGTERDELMAVDGTDTTAFVGVEREVGGVVTLTSCGMQIMGIGPVFRPSIRWTPLEANVAVTTVAAYAITIYRHGAPIRALRRAVEPTPATPALAAARVGSGMQVMTGGGVRTCDAQEVVEQRGVADVIPAIADLAEGPGGTLWVRRTKGPGTPHPIDVFETDGTYLGTLPDGSPFPALVIGDRVAAIETDDVDVERLVVYEVRREDS